METSNTITISAVIPVFNEEENLPILVPRVIEVLNQTGKPYEVVFVDDGSSDGSRGVLKKFKAEYPLIRIVALKQNRGLSTALLAGMREARGEILVTLDSDLQNDPSDIPTLLQYLDRYDMATGWRQKRDDPWSKRIASKVGNRVRNWLSGEAIHDSACTLRAFKKESVENIPVFNGMHRFMSTLVKMEGFRIVEVPVIHHPRKHGKSKYNIRNRMWRGLCDLMAVRWMKRRQIRYEIEERI
jgi:dolichol-phosphate mannosyltransferase